jgi:hypothetical protein
VLIFLALTACKYDYCKDVKCENGGTCDNGLCRCTPVYEGERCEKLAREKFIGNWKGQGPGSYECVSPGLITIEAGSAKDEIIIKGFYTTAGVGPNDYPVATNAGGDPRAFPIAREYRAKVTGNTLNFRETFEVRATNNQVLDTITVVGFGLYNQLNEINSTYHLNIKFDISYASGAQKFCNYSLLRNF